MDSQTVAPNPPSQAEKPSFTEQAEANPCLGCSAPCCRLLLLPHPTPSTFMELDYIRYMLGFPGIRMILDSGGRWQTVIEQTCRLFDPATHLCTVHNNPRKPKTCVFFNPHQCYYRANFESGDVRDLVWLSLEAFEVLLPYIHLDVEGNIVEIPAWDRIRELAGNGRTLPGETGA